MPCLSLFRSRLRRAHVPARGPHAKHAAKEKCPPSFTATRSPLKRSTSNYNALWKQVLKGHFTSTAFELDVDGNKHIVLARDVQVDPVRDTPLHVDFQRVGKDGVIRVAIPVHFVHEALSPGLKRGGVLNIVRHDVEVFCPYEKIPRFFEIRPRRPRDRTLGPHFGIETP